MTDNYRTIKKGFRSKKWKTLSSSYVIKTPWLNIKKDKVQLPNGKIIEDFFSIEGDNLIAILAVNDNQEVLLVRQYRYAISQETLDLPGGGIHKNESSITAAKRELLEETGYSAGRMQKIITYYPDSGKKGDIKHIFLAKDLKQSIKANHNKEESEKITDVKWLPLNEITSNIAKGKFREATLQLAVLYYLHYFLNPKR